MTSMLDCRCALGEPLPRVVEAVVGELHGAQAEVVGDRSRPGTQPVARTPVRLAVVSGIGR
jgi:hypothetical protein